MNRFDPATYWEDRLGEGFDLTGVGYTVLGLPYNRWLYRVRTHVFQRLLRDSGVDPRRARILDVGSGTGFYIREWLKAGATSLTASDVTRVATEGLRQRFPGIAVEQLDITGTLPFEPATFDIISAFDVLFHIVDDDLYRRAWANLATLVKPGGLLFWSENFVRGERVRLEHQVSRPAAEIADLLDELELVVVARRPMFVLMNAPVASESRARKWSWRLFTRVLAIHELVGAAAGAALFPVELALTATSREGPSTQALVCRRSASPR